jgi:uncharacterized membrane-anchored protein YitT (DUF2179 family)
MEKGYSLHLQRNLNLGRKYRIAYEIAGLTLGCFLFAFGTNQFLAPVELLAGGLGGVCVIFYHVFGWPMGIQYFLYNIPLLVLGYIHIGKKFIFYTIFSVIISSFFFDWIPIHAIWTKDTLLCAIFGAIISGIGAALILRLGGSVGGIDILSRVVAKYYNISIGRVGLIFSASIVVISAFLFDFQSAMYTILSFFVGTQTYDTILNIAQRNTVMIITNYGDNVSAELNQKFHRGVTSWNAMGVYSHTDRTVLLCVIVNGEWAELLRVVKRIDTDAFVIALPTQKIFGNFQADW